MKLIRKQGRQVSRIRIFPPVNKYKDSGFQLRESKEGCSKWGGTVKGSLQGEVDSSDVTLQTPDLGTRRKEKISDETTKTG